MFWFATLLSLTGALLNAQEKVFGFYLWIVANIIWAYEALHRSKPNWALAVVWICYTGISVYGIFHWKRSYEERY